MSHLTNNFPLRVSDSSFRFCDDRKRRNNELAKLAQITDFTVLRLTTTVNGSEIKDITQFEPKNFNTSSR